MENTKKKLSAYQIDVLILLLKEEIDKKQSQIKEYEEKQAHIENYRHLYFTIDDYINLIDSNNYYEIDVMVGSETLEVIASEFLDSTNQLNDWYDKYLQNMDCAEIIQYQIHNNHIRRLLEETAELAYVMETLGGMK